MGLSNRGKYSRLPLASVKDKSRKLGSRSSFERVMLLKCVWVNGLALTAFPK
jgi:hypothetical protein